MPYFYVYPFAVVGDRDPVPTNIPFDDALSYQNGYTVDYQLILGTDPDAKPISRSQSNQIYFDITDNIRQYQTHGIPEWISPVDNNPGGVPTPFAYDIYAQVRHGGLVYENLQNGNTSEPTPSNQSWFVISGNEGGIPVGTIIDYAAATPPSGFLNCNGQVVSRTTYSRLFTAIGVTWGSGNGTTTFAVPDLRRYTTIGSGGTPTNPPQVGAVVGNRGGAEAVTLGINEMPNHSHTGTCPSSATGNGGSVTNYGSFHAVSQHFSISIDPTGGNGAHNNMQPSAVVMKCIKF